MTNTDSIPTGPTFETALDRMNRASNFASNAKYLDDPEKSAWERADSLRIYIRAARSMLDEAEQSYVGALRAEGVTWEKIGAMLSISKQAAQQRFGR